MNRPVLCYNFYIIKTTPVLLVLYITDTKNWNFELENSDVTSSNDSRQNSDVAEKSPVPTPEDQTRFLQILKETRREYLAIFDWRILI